MNKKAQLAKLKSVDPRIEKLRIIKEKSKKPNVELSMQMGIREATFSTILNQDNLDTARPSTKKLIEIFIQDNQRFLQ